MMAGAAAGPIEHERLPGEPQPLDEDVTHRGPAVLAV
jgi:hypothetical protein